MGLLVGRVYWLGGSGGPCGSSESYEPGWDSVPGGCSGACGSSGSGRSRGFRGPGGPRESCGSKLICKAWLKYSPELESKKQSMNWRAYTLEA